MALSITLIILALAGPTWFDWAGLLNHPNQKGMQALVCVVIAGIGYLIGGGTKHSGVVIAGVLVGGVLTLLSLL